MAEERKTRELEFTNTSPHTPYGIQTTEGLVDVRPGSTVKVTMYEADADLLEKQAKADADAERAGLRAVGDAKKFMAAREKEEEAAKKAEEERVAAEEAAAKQAAEERRKAEQPRKA